MHVGIHTDTGLTVSQGDNKVCGFSSYTLEFEEFVDLVGNSAFILLDKRPRDIENGSGLITVESDRVDSLLDPFG